MQHVGSMLNNPKCRVYMAQNENGLAAYERRQSKEELNCVRAWTTNGSGEKSGKERSKQVKVETQT